MTPLQQLVVDIDRQHAGQDSTQWVQVIGSVRDPQFVRDEDLGHLFGFVAPPECSAMAMTAPGWARPTDLPAESAHADRQRVRITCVVARDGGVAGRIRWADSSLVDEAPQAGRSLDILRRCLGLPTDPPAVPTGALLAAQWLDAVSRLARRRAKPLTWNQVATQHPAMVLARQGGLPVSADDLVTVARLAAGVWCWSELLRQAGEPGPLSEALPAGGGRWMDEGMLARWLLAPYPPLAEHLALVVALVRPDTGRRIERALEALGLSTCGVVDRAAASAY